MAVFSIGVWSVLLSVCPSVCLSGDRETKRPGGWGPGDQGPGDQGPGNRETGRLGTGRPGTGRPGTGKPGDWETGDRETRDRETGRLGDLSLSSGSQEMIRSSTLTGPQQQKG